MPVDSLRAAGEERYFRQAFDTATAIWKVELTRARATKNVAAEARARMWLGLAAYRTGDYAAARSEGERALVLKRQIGLDGELSRSFNGLGLLAWNEGRYSDALALFDSAVASAERHHDKAGIARAAGNIPLVRVELGEFDIARRGFQRAIALGKEIGDERAYGNGLDNLGMLEIRLGNASKALVLLAEARRAYAKFDYAPGEANALGQIATARAILGDLQAAITAADSALLISRANGLQQEIASNLEVLADLQVQAGDSRVALSSLREADSLDKQLGLISERGTNLRRTSIILLAVGETSPAIRTAADALGAHSVVGALSEVVLDRIQLAEALSKNGESSKARAQSDSALHEARSMNNPVSIREASAVAARISLDAGDARGALAQLTTANVASENDWRLLDLESEALMGVGRLVEAQNAAQRSLARLEHERNSLDQGPLRSGYIGNKIAPFARLVAIHAERHDTAGAFAVAVGALGRSFAEQKAGWRSGPPSYSKERASLKKIDAIEAELGKVDAKTGSEQRAALIRSLGIARNEYERDMTSPLSGTGTGVTTNISLGQLQSKIHSDEAVLIYLSGSERVDCFAVRRNRIQYWKAMVRDQDLLQRVRVARTAAEASIQHKGNVLSSFGQLYDLLVDPAVVTGTLAGAVHVSIVLNGNLEVVPFAALWDRRSGHFLIEERELSYRPGIVSIAREQRGSATSRVAIFAPFPDSLPGTATEARALSRLLPRSTISVGNVASERSVRDAISAGRPIHIASHGMHNVQNPLLSLVRVGRARGNSADDDGRLDVSEILGLRTTSPLVFLSGCETALGSAGDGPFQHQIEEGSLSQAFLVAGASKVVATLWRINDARAVRITESFYSNLQMGMSPERALAMSQRREIAKGEGLSWAAYSIYSQPGT